jgi:gliding motility-associated-like protein
MCTPSQQLEATPATNPDLANLSFLWTTAETTRPITITLPGTYGVTITNNITGCSSSGNITIVDDRPTVDLGPDFPTCSDVPRTLNAGNPAATFVWEIDGSIVSTAQQLAVNTTLLGTRDYKVTATNSNGCSASDDVMVTVNPIPTFTETVLTQPACGASTGEIRVDITSAGTYTVDFSGPSANNVRFNQPTGPVLPTYQNLAGGTYNVIVTNDLTGCDTQGAVGLNNSGFTVTPVPPTPSCTPVAVTVNQVGGTGALSYIFTNTLTNQVIGPNTNPAAASFSTVQIAPGSYVLQVTDASNCVSTANVNILQNAPVTFDLDPLCATVIATPTNIASANAQYTWTSPGITAGQGTSTITLMPNTPSSPNWNVLVTVGDVTNTFCPSTQSINVIVDNNAAASFTQSDPCTSPVMLSALPAGPYTYTWSESGVPAGTGQPLSLTTVGSFNYTLNVQSNVSGCNLTPATNPVEVKDKLSVIIDVPTVCDGQEFTLTATPVPSNATITWEKNNAPITKPNSFVETLSGNATVKYKAIATLDGCAPVSDEEDITPFRVDPPQLPIQATICDEDAAPIADQQVVLKTGVGEGGTFEWFKNGVLQPDEVADSLVAKSTGLYVVNFTNTFECKGTDKTQVVKDCKPALEAPNAFRPDNASTLGNDVFKVFPRFVSPDDFSIFIFNRWGEMVYQNSDLQFKWNGTHKVTGVPLPPGTYSWVAKYKSEFDSKKPQEKHGGVVLLR